MALIKCEECGKEISDKASACPNCGAPIEKETKKVIITRERNFSGSALKTYITVDNQNVANIMNGETIELDVPIGKHIISVNTVGHNGEATSFDSEQIDITSETNQVNILIGFKYSFIAELAGQNQSIKILEVDYE